MNVAERGWECEFDPVGTVNGPEYIVSSLDTQLY